MSRDATSESNSSLRNGLQTKSTPNTQTFLETCVLDDDHKALRHYLMVTPVQQSDLDRCLLRGLLMVQRCERELSHVAPALTLLLQFGAKWNNDALLVDQKTPYHIICESPGDHHELLDLMIKSSQRSIIDTQDNRRRTAVMYAVQNANINCLKCLITNGADVNIGYCRSNFEPGAPTLQWTPIMEATEKLCYAESISAINVEIFDVLLDSGADINTHSVEPHMRPIIFAVGFGHVYCIKKLIQKGARLDITDQNNRYVWSMIAGSGNIELLNCMFNHGIDKDSTDQNGFSLLWHVVTSGNVEAVRYLLDLGVNILSYKPEHGKMNQFVVNINQEIRDPCMKAICQNKLEIVKLLEDYGSQSCTLFTALRRAVIYNSEDVTSYLLNKYKYPLNMEYTKESGKSKFIYTLLTEPRSVYNAEITKLLLDHGADPAKPMSAATSVNAMMTAIAHGDLKTIAKYIRSGVDINFKSYDCTYGNVLPFESSVLRGDSNVAEMLLISGCSCGVLISDNNHKNKVNLKPEVEKLMKEWNVYDNNVTLLMQRCRSVLLNHLSPQADMKIEKLPLPRWLIKFLGILELDNIIEEYNKADRA